MSEAKLQRMIIRWLRNNGFYVIKCQIPPAPMGCPDIFAVYEGFWLALEVKASKKSHKQPLQAETVQKLNDWSYCKFVTHENWDEIRTELEQML